MNIDSTYTDLAPLPFNMVEIRVVRVTIYVARLQFAHSISTKAAAPAASAPTGLYVLAAPVYMTIVDTVFEVLAIVVA